MAVSQPSAKELKLISTGGHFGVVILDQDLKTGFVAACRHVGIQPFNTGIDFSCGALSLARSMRTLAEIVLHFNTRETGDASKPMVFQQLWGDEHPYITTIDYQLFWGLDSYKI